jgi:hypothetical protein
MAHNYKRKAEAGGSGVPEQPGLYIETLFHKANKINKIGCFVKEVRKTEQK